MVKQIVGIPAATYLQI